MSCPLSTNVIIRRYIRMIERNCRCKKKHLDLLREQFRLKHYNAPRNKVYRGAHYLQISWQQLSN